MASGGRPNSSSRCRLQIALPLRSAAEYGAGMCGSVSGFHSCVIHAVEDAGEHAGAGAQRAIQAEAELRRLDLARIGGADRAQRVGEHDPALDVADPAEKLHAVRTVDGGVQRHLRQRGFREQSLVSQVVDGEQRAAAEKGRVGGEGGAQVGGHQPALPVVAMKDVGSKQDAGHAQRGAAEHGKANVVVRVVHAGFAVEALCGRTAAGNPPGTPDTRPAAW